MMNFTYRSSLKQDPGWGRNIKDEPENSIVTEKQESYSNSSFQKDMINIRGCALVKDART